MRGRQQITLVSYSVCIWWRAYCVVDCLCCLLHIVLGLAYFEGSRPEWCISTIYHAWDTPFWSGTLDFPFPTSACHQCRNAGLSLCWDLNFWAMVCGLFWNSLSGVFFQYPDVCPHLHQSNVSANERKLRRTAVLALSRLIAALPLCTLWHTAFCMW